MKVCIIGSTGHINYAMDGIKQMPDVEVSGVAPGSTTEDMDKILSNFETENKQTLYWANWQEMLDTIKPDIVVVGCYFNEHAKIAAASLERGCHVFIEKPVATTLDDLAMLKETYQKAEGCQLATMFGLRYTPWFFTAWQQVKEGAIGEIRLLNAQKSYRLRQRANFFKKRETYGGTIPWVGSHAIDWIYWFSGKEFSTVLASHSNMANDGHGELEATAVCQYTMTDEVLATVSLDYLRPNNAHKHNDDRLRLVGTKGIIEVRNQQVLLTNKENPEEQSLPLATSPQIFVDLVNQIKGQGQCLISAEDSFYITEVCLKSRLSADEKRIIKI